MADAVDEDLRAGAKAAWSGFVETLALIPAARIYSGAVPAGVATPYMKLDSVPNGAKQMMSGSDYFDPKKLIVRVWGLEAVVKGIAGYVRAVFGKASGFPIANTVVMLSIPHDEKLTEEPKTREGDPVWKLEQEFNLLLARELESTAGFTVP